ncbi:MAG: hypothetical protein ABIE23_03350 [archaeon]
MATENIIIDNINFFVLLINVLSLAGGVFTATMIHYAYKKFEKNEFSNILKWVAISVAFIVINRIIEVFNDYLTVHNYLVFFIAKVFLFIAIVSMVYTSLKIFKLTKIPASDLPTE